MKDTDSNSSKHEEKPVEFFKQKDIFGFDIPSTNPEEEQKTSEQVEGEQTSDVVIGRAPFNENKYFKYLFSAQGRMRRKDFWIFSLVALIPYLLIILMWGSSIGLSWLAFLLFIPYIIISVFLTIKRFHDINYSGWCFLLLLIPLVNIGGSLLLLFKDGTIGPNQYGDDPKKRTQPPPKPQQRH